MRIIQRCVQKHVTQLRASNILVCLHTIAENNPLLFNPSCRGLTTQVFFSLVGIMNKPQDGGGGAMENTRPGIKHGRVNLEIIENTNEK